MDKGPWKASEDGRNVMSDDFDHDVMLTISGDFESPEQRLSYATWLAQALNDVCTADVAARKFAEAMEAGGSTAAKAIDQLVADIEKERPSKG